MADKKDGKSTWAIGDGLLTGSVPTIANDSWFGQYLAGIPAYVICSKYPALITVRQSQLNNNTVIRVLAAFHTGVLRYK